MPVRRTTKRPLNKKAATDPLFGKPLSNSDKCEIREIEAMYAAEYEPQSLEDFRILWHLSESWWKMRRADEMEVELFTANMPEDEKDPDMALAKAFMKDANGPNVLGKIMRYRERAEILYYKCLRAMQARKKQLAVRRPVTPGQPAAEAPQIAPPPRLTLIRGNRQGGQAPGPASQLLRLVH